MRYDKSVKRNIMFSVFKYLFVFSILLFLSSAKNAYAGFSCAVSPTTVSPDANITIDGGGNFSPTKKFYVSVNGNKVGATPGYRGVPGSAGALFSPTNGKITFKLPSTYKSGTLAIGVYMQEDSGTNICNNNPSVSINSGGGGGNSCTVQFVNSSFSPSDYVSIKITGSQSTTGKADDLLRTYIKLNDNNGATIWNGCIKRGDLVSGFGFGYLSTANYYLQVQDRCNTSDLFFWNGENMACYAKFFVDINGGGVSGTGDAANPIPPGPCSAGANANGACTKVDTGLGISIGTDPKSIIQAIFSLVLSVSGGIALLLIIISGYRVLSSQGNPEALKGAREQLTAAIVGLLFIILSLVILQVIGVDILHIPGFG